MTSSKSGFNFTKFYFTVVSIVSVIGLTVAYGIAAYSGLMSLIITDEEYLLGRESREIENCKYEKQRNMAPINVQPLEDGRIPDVEIPEPTAEEIATCEAEATQRTLQRRRFDTKESVISGIVRGTLFLILFLFHYPRMMHIGKNDGTDQD